jgi:integral membrane sensor domain MASE1
LSWADRYKGKNRSGYECSITLVCSKLYPETSPAEDLKEGVAVVEEVGSDDGAAVRPALGATVNGAAVGPAPGATVVGAAVGPLLGATVDGAAV